MAKIERRGPEDDLGDDDDASGDDREFISPLDFSVPGTEAGTIIGPKEDGPRNDGGNEAGIIVNRDDEPDLGLTPTGRKRRKLGPRGPRAEKISRRLNPEDVTKALHAIHRFLYRITDAPEMLFPADEEASLGEAFATYGDKAMDALHVPAAIQEMTGPAVVIFGIYGSHIGDAMGRKMAQAMRRQQQAQPRVRPVQTAMQGTVGEHEL